jgi:predicted dithiol-disulfide oxidoreductase (DUF899 family)
MSTSKHSVRFPGESQEYRAARDKLLDAEIELRRQTESVAALRRKLPLGGEVREDYVFDEAAGDGSVRQVRLSQLFADGKDTLVLYNYMYGPQMAQPCVSCTSMLDGLNGQAPHISQRINLAVVAKSPIERILEFTRQRGWKNLRLVSSAGNTYNSDYKGEEANGSQRPALNVFVRRDGRIHHFYNTETMFMQGDPGQDPRHIDTIWPLWNVFDLTPDGRGEKWYPKLAY